MREKSASEHNFSGVGCNFRVFQGIFPGANKIQGSSGSSKVCWPPCMKLCKFLLSCKPQLLFLID